MLDPAGIIKHTGHGGSVARKRQEKACIACRTQGVWHASGHMQCVLRWHFMQAPVEISRQRTFQHEKEFLRRRHLHRTTGTAPCLQQCDSGASALDGHATQCAAAALIQPRTARRGWRRP